MIRIADIRMVLTEPYNNNNVFSKWDKIYGNIVIISNNNQPEIPIHI